LFGKKSNRLTCADVGVSNTDNAQAFYCVASDSAQAFYRVASDDAFIHAAMAADGTRLVSGDDDLICLHTLGALHILSPRLALDELS